MAIDFWLGFTFGTGFGGVAASVWLVWCRVRWNRRAEQRVA